MDWWVLELFTNALLVGVALWLGPLIKRFGKSYAADVFRANPRTGKSFIVLTDIAYYLIFFSYVLFTVSFEPKGGWDQTVGGAQLQHEVARIGGILLILGVLHGLNLIALPVMGRLLTLNRRLDQETPSTSRRPPTSPPAPPRRAPRASRARPDPARPRRGAADRRAAPASSASACSATTTGRERSGLLALLSAPVVVIAGVLLLAVLALGVLLRVARGGHEAPDAAPRPPQPQPRAAARSGPPPATCPRRSRAQIEPATNIPLIVMHAEDDDRFPAYQPVSGLAPGAVVRVQVDGFGWHEGG